MIKYIITDFDGTLVDTLEANMLAYKAAFEICGYNFSEEEYKKAYGYRFDDMCNCLGVTENKKIREKIKGEKQKQYPKYFDKIKINETLLHHIASLSDMKVAVATTASKANFDNVMDKVLHATVDATVTGDDVERGKPSPDVYIQAMKKLGCENPNEVLVFEDTEIGIQAAQAAGINNIIKV